VKYLVDCPCHGADVDVNKQNLLGNTPLHHACKNNNKTIVRYLIEHGADINIKNYNLYTMLHYACENKNENLVKYLIEKGANIYIKNKLGDTPFEIAQKKMLKILWTILKKKR
ncbi:hypothetical protein PIROE2DRAFT_49272, partial [Piromyces sp. E2]